MTDDILTILCKYCGSANVVKYGNFKGIQRYFCKGCKRKFVNSDTLLKMKTPKNEIAAAIGMYYGGMPLDAIQRQLEQDYGNRMSESGIYYWVVRFSKDAIKQAKDFKPIIGDTWIADETVLKVGGQNVWFFDVIDRDSRYLLASHITTSRSIRDVEAVMNRASQTAGKSPKVILTDKLAAYLDGIELTFGADTKHKQSKPFVSEDSTNIIERFHGTLKDRTNVIRGFKNMDTARLLTDAWLVHYNFFKEHESLGNVSPAVKMGKPLPFKDWQDVVDKGEVLLAVRPVSNPSLRNIRRPVYRKVGRTGRIRYKRIPPPSLGRL